MKKILYITVLIAALASATSCMKDFLDPKAKSSLESELIFSDPSLANDAVMGIYQYIINQGWNSRHIWTGINNDAEICDWMSEKYTTTNNYRAFSMYNFRSSDAMFSSYFSGAYICIERANLCIEGLRKYGDLSDPATAYLLGESLFMRAWLYYEMVSIYGPIPARFEPMSESTLYLGRSDIDVILKQLLADLNEAASLMPWAGENTYTTTTLRPSKAAAKALRARIALMAGGKGPHLYGDQWLPNTFSKDPDLTVAKTYAIARSECADLMANEGKGYRLESDYEKIFRDNVWPRHDIDSEPLWKLPFDYNNRGDFMVTWGLYHTGANANKIKNDPYTTTYQGQRVRAIATLWYDFDKNDKRRNLSVLPMYYYDGRQYLTRITRLSLAKWQPEWGHSQFTINQGDGITPIILRYADVLLMFAEAENELNGPTAAAKEALKRVRERGFGSDQTDYVNSVGATKADFLKAVQDERKWEFTAERIRKNDLIRWGLLKTNMDIAKENMRKLRNFEPPYEDVPLFVFWRFQTEDDGSLSDSRIEWYGFERGEKAPGTENATTVGEVDNTVLVDWMTNGGWQYYYPNVPKINNVNEQYISTTYLPDDFIGGMYLNDPDRYQVLPIPAPIIVNSQGALSNDFLGYDE